MAEKRKPGHKEQEPGHRSTASVPVPEAERGATAVLRQEEQAPSITIESEPRESLPRVGTPLQELTVRVPRFPGIPGVDAIDPGQKISWKQIAFVRATDIAPQITKDGDFVLETPYAGTKTRQDIDEVDPRTTLHFAINHHVRASPGGWQRDEPLPFIVIIPGAGLVEAHGRPDNFSDVDSFWQGNLTLPPDTVILKARDIKITIPQQLQGKVHVVDRDPGRSPEADVADILARMQYTPIKGGKQYSRTEGVSEVFNRFAEQEVMESGEHQRHPTNIFEERYAKLNSPQLLQMLRRILRRNRKQFNPQAEELLTRKLDEIADANDDYIRKFAQRNGMSFNEARELFVEAKELLTPSITRRRFS